MQEIWKPVVGFEGYYEVSSLGNVRSVDRVDCKNRFLKTKILKQIHTHDGYLMVHLSKDGKKRHHRVHRLVAQAFLPNPDNLPQVNHRDENVKNNKVDNLEWCDTKYNQNYGTIKKRKSESQINDKKKSKIIYQYTLDMVFVREWPSTHEIERSLGFNRRHVSECCRGILKTSMGFIWKFAYDVDKEKGAA